eukprot:gene22874-22026_t
MNTIFKCAAVLGVVAMLVGSGSATITVRGCFYDDDTCSTKASVGFMHNSETLAGCEAIAAAGGDGAKCNARNSCYSKTGYATNGGGCSGIPGIKQCQSVGDLYTKETCGASVGAIIGGIAAAIFVIGGLVKCMNKGQQRTHAPLANSPPSARFIGAAAERASLVISGAPTATKRSASITCKLII